MKWIFVLLLLSVFVCVGSGAEFIDTFQHQTAIADNWRTFGDPISTWSYVSAGSTYNKEAYVSCGQYGASTRGIRMKYPSQSNYWSFFLHQVQTGAGAQTGYIKACFWDSTNTSYVEFTVDGPFQTDLSWWTRNYHLEFQYESGSIYWKINGVSQGVGCACSFTPYYIGIGGSKGAPAGGVHYRFDNVHNQKGIVGICDESNNLNHSITELANDELSNTWGINTIPIAEYNTSQFDMEVKRATWAEIYNTTRIKDGGNATILPYGSFAYSWDDIFRTDHYGLYWFNLYRTLSGEPELVGQDFLYFKDVGEPSTINIEDTEYAIGETMNISYYIDSPDFGANQYKIQIFDSTGQLKDERVLTQQAATEQITSTIDWEEGMLYAVLVKDTKPAITEDPPEDIIDLAFDFCTMSNVIYIIGKVYDASNADMLVDGTLLDNVSLNWTQAGTIYNTTSDANGNYEFIDATTLLEVEWFQDVPIEVTASKENYTHDNFTMTIIKAGRYVVDIYLVPDIDMSSTAINGLVQDDIFHQAIPQATVNIWNGITNSTYTNNWGWYEFSGLANGTYYMTAEKETYRTSSVVTVPTFDVSYVLDTCDNLTYYEAVLDDCDGLTSWSSENTLTLNTTDYIEATGSLHSRGYNTTDFNKTFSPGVDSNVSVADGYFYFYSKILNTTNISSQNITVTISSNTTGATDKRVWQINKTWFNDTWDLYVLKMSDAVQTGTCNLSNITYFEFESTKSNNVTTLIDYLAFIEYAGWDSCLDLEIDTGNKVEGTGSLNVEGKLYPACDLVLGMFWTPAKDCALINKNSETSRLVYYQWDTQTHTDNVYLFDSDGDYVMWAPEMNSGWDTVSLYFSDGVESGDFETSKLAYLSVYSHTINYYDVNYDYVQLVQKGDTRQNFLLSQNYNLMVYAKDMDTRYTITSFTAILDSTTVVETTTGAIVFPNVTYGIYPLEVSANGYYTNKQYVFMGQDTTQTVYLTKIENVSESGAGLYYPPRAVEFKTQTFWGSAVADVNVSATALETSGSSWNWLWEVMGMSEDISEDIQNGTMNGTTDSMGKISFMMVETVKYTINFEKASESINTTITIYPKDTHYVIIVGSKSFVRDTEWYEAVNFTVTWSEINNTHGYINMSYNDVSNETLNLTLYINNSNSTNVWNNTYYGSCNQTDVQTIVNKEGGKSFYVGFSADHVTFGHSPLNWEQVLKFEWFLDVGIPHDACMYLSVGFLVLFACFFGATTVEMGGVFVSMFAWVFHFFGWLEVRDEATTYLVLAIITTLSVLAYIAARSRRVYRN